MRLDNTNFSLLNAAPEKEPRYVIEIAFDTGATDLWYFTSHADALLPASVTTNKTVACIESLSVQSQKLDPINSNFTIGSIAFNVVDIDNEITDLLSDKWEADKTTSDKRVRVYVGYEPLTTFDDYVLIQTQLLGNIITAKAGYLWQCRDIQRSMNNQLFDPNKTTLRGAIDFNDTFIPAYAVWDGRILHDSSYTDAPGSTVGYLVMDDEIIRYSSISTTPGSEGFNVDTNGRGALGTRAAAHGIDETELYSDGTVQVTSGSASITGEDTEWDDLDANNRALISPGDGFYISKENGGDGQIYEILTVDSDTEITLKTNYQGPSGSGKTYKILRASSSERQAKIDEYIYFEGPAPKLALKLLTGSYLSETFPSNWHLGIDTAFVSTSQFTGVGDDWWDTGNDEGVHLRFEKPKPEDGKKFIEKEMMLAIGGFMPIGANGEIGLSRMVGVLTDASAAVELNESNIVSYSNLTYQEEAIQNFFVIRWNWDAIRETFTRNTIVDDQASAAKFKRGKTKQLAFKGVHGSKTTEAVLIGQMDSLRDRYTGYPKFLKLEVIPGLNTIEVGDIVRVTIPQIPDHTGAIRSLDSTFEVQSVSINWINGTVMLGLFGTSSEATPSSVISQEGKQPLAWYQSQGTDLSTVLTIDGSGNIADGQTLNGSSTMETSIFYYDGDLTLPVGFTLTITNNIQLRVRGFFQNNGVIDGSGNGHAGGAATTDRTGTQGVIGLVGNTKSDGGMFGDYRGHSFHTDDLDIWSNEVAITTGKNPVPPSLDLKWVTGVLTGLTGDFRPTSGGGGGGGETDNPPSIKAGGAGGKGGAALVLVCQGFAGGVSSEINLDGEPGLAGSVVSAYSGLAIYSGSGASGCGGPLYVVLDGNTSTAGTTNLSSVRPVPFFDYTVRPPYSRWKKAITSGGPNGCYYPFAGFLDSSGANQRIQYLPAEADPVPDRFETSDDVLAVLVSQNLDSNAQVTKITNLEISVTEPPSGNYSHAVAYIREAASENAWTRVGEIPKGQEIVYPVAADGATWEIIARSVSIDRIESESGAETSITVIDLIDPTQPVNQSDQQTLDDQIPVPDVDGLEIFNQGNNTTFSGHDCKIRWNKVAGISAIEFGTEPDGLGSDAGQEDYYFDFYSIKIFDSSGNILRVEFVKDNQYIYTFEKNAEDFSEQNPGLFGAYRDIDFEVTVVTIDNRESDNPAKLSVNNPKPVLSGVSLSGVFQGIKFSAIRPDDLDFRGVRVWLSEKPSFTVDENTLIYDNPNVDFQIPSLKSNTTYYLRWAALDAYGLADFDLSDELAVKTQKSLGGDRVTQGAFFDNVPVGGVFAATGDVAFGDYDPGDVVTIPPGTWRLEMGPVDVGPITYVIRFHDGDGDQSFFIDADGSFEFGKVSTGKGISFDTGTGDIELGNDTKILGTDAYEQELFFYHTYFDSLEAFKTNISANGSIAQNLTGGGGILVEISPAPGAETTQFARSMALNGGAQTLKWSKPYRFKHYLGHSIRSTASFFIGFADAEPIVSNTQRIGIFGDGSRGKYYGQYHDGTTLTEVEIGAMGVFPSIKLNGKFEVLFDGNDITFRVDASEAVMESPVIVGTSVSWPLNYQLNANTNYNSLSIFESFVQNLGED
jgi:hypothetical protein